MIILPFVISFYIGYLIIDSILRGKRKWTDSDVFLVPGIGLGVSSQIVFYSLLLWNQISPIFIIAVHLLVIGILLTLKLKSKRNLSVTSQMLWTRFLLFALFFIVYLCVSSLVHPNGDWDAWSYWNFRANFILRSGVRWEDIFHYNLQGFHPLYLPLVVVWQWLVVGQENFLLPLMTACIFTISTAGLLFGALRTYIGEGKAMIAGLLLCSSPYFLYHGASQYADIITAYFLLGAGALTIRFLTAVSIPDAALCGLCLGFLAFTKDNGIVAAFILLIMTMVFLLKNRIYLVNLKITGFYFALIGISVAAVKYLSSLNKINHAYDCVPAYLFDIHRWMVIVKYIGQNMLDVFWGGVWIVAGIALILCRKKFRQRETQLLLGFLVIYFSLYLAIYCVSVLQLEWLLRVSMERFLYLLIPLFLFVIFYGLYRIDPIKEDN